MTDNAKTPREKLREAKARFEKAKETFAKAQQAWQKSRREFTDTLAHGAEAVAAADSENADD